MRIGLAGHLECAIAGGCRCFQDRGSWADIKSSANRRLAFDAKAVAINLPEASGRIRAQRTRPLLHHRQTPDRAEALDYAKKASALPIEIDPIAVDRFTPVVRKSV
ncbi:hypothetical protein ACVWZZ_003419 [Bradyrhizobium sp. LM6.10]|uniref:hypothetical protein n=1 Tax=Bradyrhizobium sp. LB14.3 TaxID=3156328 RepID=UPI00339A1A78